MRRTAKAEKRRERLITAAISLFAGIGILAAASSALSLMAVTFDLSDGAVAAMSGIALAAGCFSCAFCAANRRRRDGLKEGLLLGLGAFLLTLITGMLTVRVFSAGGLAAKLIIMLASSAIGGIRGVNARPVFKK